MGRVDRRTFLSAGAGGALLCTIGGTRVALRGPGDAAALHDIQQSSWSLPYYLPALGFLIGLPVLAISAARAGIVPVWAGALLTLGALMVGTETLIISNAYFVAGAVVLLLGGIAVAAPLARMSDAEFAAAPS